MVSLRIILTVWHVNLEYKDLEARVDALRNAHLGLLKYVLLYVLSRTLPQFEYLQDYKSLRI